MTLVAAEIVHDDDVAGAERRHQKLFDISAKAEPIDRPVEDAGRIDAVAAQGRQEGQSAPASVRHLGDQPGATSTTPVTARHVGLGPSLVDEDQALGVKPALMLLPPSPPARDVGAVLLAGVQAFF